MLRFALMFGIISSIAFRSHAQPILLSQDFESSMLDSRIAKRFKISSHTVHMHLNRLFKKLSVTSRTELVLRIVEQMVTLTLSETAVLPPIITPVIVAATNRPPRPPNRRNASSVASAPSATTYG